MRTLSKPLVSRADLDSLLLGRRSPPSPHVSNAAGRERRAARLWALAAAVIFGFALCEGVVILGNAAHARWVPAGVDFVVLRDFAAGWLAGGPLYPAAQTSGAYNLGGLQSLYPPTVLYLTLPFTILPAVLWWAVPCAVFAYVVWRHRPARWSWPLLALIAAVPRSHEIVLYGNPSMWLSAAVAAATIWPWAAVGMLLKPTLAPLALVGVRHRSWWIAAAVLLVASIPFGSLWIDYYHVVVNMRGGNPLYSLPDVPLVVAGLVAWAASRSRGEQGPEPATAGQRSLRTKITPSRSA